MPKTPAERQRERRARLKSNPEALELYQTSDRLRKEIKRLNMSPEDLTQLRQRTKLHTRQWREKVKSLSPATTPDDDSSTPYKSAQAYGRAKRKVEHVLPKSPHKRLAVLEGIASRYLSVKFKSSSPIQNTHGIDTRTKTIIRGYYQNDSISRMAPGKADVITVRDEDGFKEKLQKRHMNMTISEAFQLFKLDHPDIEVGKSSFAALRPKFVLLSSQMPQNVCGCKYHNNIILLLESLHRKWPQIPLYTKQGFLSQCVCDVSSEVCMSNNCDTCSNGEMFKRNVSDPIEEAEEMCRWYQWEEDADGYLVKRRKEGSFEEAIASLETQLPRFQWHVFIKGRQAEAYESDKLKAQAPDSTSCMLQMDFAENYTASFQDEIQSAHWRQRQISIYTMMVWTRGLIDSSIVVSDVKDHDKRAVATYTYIALDKIKRNNPYIRAVDIWSDGPSSQFKNRFIFALLQKLEKHFDIVLTWNFSATSHGKGPNDALGGNAKRIVHRQVLTRQAVITDAQSFADAVKSSSSQMQVICSSEQDINEKIKLLGADEIWPSTPAVSGIINTHYVATQGEGIICTKFYKTAESYKTHVLFNNNKDVASRDDDTESSTSESSVASRDNDTESSSSESEDIPLARFSSKAEIVYPCGKCSHVYGSADDPKKTDEWLKCKLCNIWFHESCAEDCGIVDDSGIFSCRNCL